LEYRWRRTDRVEVQFYADVGQQFASRTAFHLDLEEGLSMPEASSRVQKRYLNSARSGRGGSNRSGTNGFDDRPVLGFEQPAYIIDGELGSTDEVSVRFDRPGKDPSADIDNSIHKGMAGAVVLGLHVVSCVADLDGGIESEDPGPRRLLLHDFLSGLRGKTLTKTSGAI
jgi:hypothetical protein